MSHGFGIKKAPGPSWRARKRAALSLWVGLMGLRGLRRLVVRAAHEVMEGEGNFVRMGSAPGNDALELDGIVGDGADFHQFSLDGLGISHRKLQDDTEFLVRT